jgi:predicted nucleotidyltransferase
MPFDLAIVRLLNEKGVEFVVVGGLAAVAHGSSLVTDDVDVCAPLAEPNLSRILAAVRGLNPRLRMRPDKMRLPEDPARLTNLKNLYLDTDLATIDFLGEVSGVGTFAEAIQQSQEVDLGEGLVCRMLTIDALIAAKKAAGRPKDLRAVRELEIIRDKLRE